jgi:endonuclease/exonuclease/phosphatase (EEP) superfamily protein YafD
MLGLLQAAAIVTIVFSVITSLGLNDYRIELFAHFRLQYLVVSILLLLAFGALRSVPYTLLLLATAGFNAYFIVPWYTGGNVAAAIRADAERPQLKLLHANVLSSNAAYDRLIALLDVERPDVVFLQEVTPAWVSGLQRIEADYPYRYLEPLTGNFGIALYSRLPLVSATHVSSPPLGHPTIVTTLEFDGELLTLVSSHPTIPVRAALREARDEQINSLAELADALDGNVVLSGDFNTTLWERVYRQLEQRTGLRNVRRGVGLLPTWPTFLPIAMIPIDHVLVSERVHVVAARTGARIGSDHLPLVVTLSLDPGPRSAAEARDSDL